VLERKLADSLRASMQRLRVERIDLLLLHSQLQPDDGPFAPRLLSVRPFREVVRPAFERLREEGVNRWMGLTDVGHPRARYWRCCPMIRFPTRSSASPTRSISVVSRAQFAWLHACKRLAIRWSTAPTSTGRSSGWPAAWSAGGTWGAVKKRVTRPNERVPQLSGVGP
jgi:aryl-alcohol dehydrogenase-like predicted oxidoreductase